MSSWTVIVDSWLRWMVAASWQIALLVCLIGALTYVLRGASARLRYGLWLLVLVKALLPPTLAAFWAVGSWGVAPMAELGRQAGAGVIDVAVVDQEGGIAQAIDERLPVAFQDSEGGVLIAGVLFAVWIAGCLALWAAVAWKYWRLVKTVGAMRQIDEGPVRVELERLAERFGIRRVPELYVTEEPVSPMLIGVLRPKIVLPASVLSRLGERDVHMILAHELVHWRRRDTWVGWLQVLVQGLLWFHPFVWLANARIRHERECACDEMVLRDAPCNRDERYDRDEYGETLLRVLTAARGRSLVMANMVGVFERGSRLQTRLEEIMSFDPTKRRFGWVSRVAVLAAALLLLPMAVPRVSADDADDGAVATSAKVDRANDAADGRAKRQERRKRVARPKTNGPVIVESSPAIGATEVDPSIEEISVTFDRDMDIGGYSWTGAGPSHPESPAGSTPVWIDKRTCVLPVKLKKGSFYRVGINSTSFQNFRSAMGVAAETTAIYFATKDAPRAIASRVRVPKIVKSVPEIGETDVDPRLGLIRVTFNIPMDTGGFSWTGGGPSFPTIPDGQKPRWSRDGKSCTLPVKLEPGHKYELGLNSVSHKNFGSKWGVPLEPVHFVFTTSGGTEGATADAEGSGT
jgi:beta-lactamase regulating signal transducer with metallopeptidase domain